MKLVIATMSLLTAAIILVGGYAHHKYVPQSVATAVIAEKPGKSMGGQAATLLPATISGKQASLLQMAYTFAKAEGLSPEMVQSVLLQETNAGGLKSYKVANPGPEAYFGPMQIKLAATKDVLKRSPTLFDKYGFHTRTDDEIKANLILNESFNVEVGTKYLRMLKEQYGFTGRTLMNAYNRGAGGVQSVDSGSFHYAIGAESKLASWKAKH